MSQKTFAPKGVSFMVFSRFKDLSTPMNTLIICKNRIRNYFLPAFICLLPLILISSSSAFAGVTITKGTNPSFCSTYPSPYVSVGDFSIAETRIKGGKGFKAGQTNATLILGFGGTGTFEFLPGTGTVTETGTEVTINSVTITATSITVNITTTATNIEKNSIVYKGIQVRATSAGNGFIRRNPSQGGAGGTFRIDNKANKPSAATSWCDLTAGTPFAVTGSTATQTVISSVFSGSTDNQIIGVQVVIGGTCSLLTATAFNFNTTGSTNAAADILNAKLYFTNTANAFSTATLFGSKSAPNGPFTITGSQDLTAGQGTYYFWLVYDIKTAATNTNVVDAQLVSSVISGTTFSPTTGNPNGSRPISTNVFYSIAPGSWNSTTIWSRTSGGVNCGCSPATGITGFVYVNHAVSLDDANHTVNYVTVQNGGNLTNAATRVLTVTDNLNTTGTGRFAASTSWGLKDVTTAGTGSSSSSAALTLTGSLNVGSGTTLQMTGGGLLTINGNILVNGTLALGTSNATCSNAAGTTIEGTGSITGSGTITLGVNKSIAVGSNLTISPILSLLNGVIVANNGTVNMQNNITGGNNGSTWTNTANSVLNMGGTISTILSTGTLNAFAIPNTVNYNASGNQTIKTPTLFNGSSSGNYYNLMASTSGTKTCSDITITNSLQISGSAQLNAGASTINFNGDWVNNSSDASAFTSTGTVIFIGDANISGTGVNSFNNVSIGPGGAGLLTSNSNPGKVKVTGNWTNGSDFDPNNSDITFDGTTVISGGQDSVATEFNTVIVNASKTLTLYAETGIDGDLTSNGTVNHNNGLLAFVGIGNTQNINGATGTLNLYQVVIDNPGGSVLMGRPVTINNALTLTNGNLDIGSNNLTLGSAVGAVGGGPFSASKMIVASGGGAVVKNGTSASSASYIFPVGDNTGTPEYSPIRLTFTTGTYTAGSASVKVVNAKHPNSSGAADFLNRYWTVATSGYTVTGATVAATYTDADIKGTEANILMDRYDGLLPWTRFPASINTATNTLTSPSISSFGDFSGQGCTIGLAIEISTLGNVSACGAVGTDDGKGFFTIRVFPRIGGIATAFKPYTWTLDGIPTNPIPEISAPFKFPGLLPKTYSVIMTDGAGCASNTLPVIIGTDAPLVVNLSGWGNPTTCGGTNGDITVLNTGGSGSTYRYRISSDGGTTWSAEQSGRRFGGLVAGTYTIEGRDSRGCTATLIKTLNNPKGCPSAIAGSTDKLTITAKNSLGLQVFPNPTRTSFTLNLQSSSRENVLIIVTDISGKKLYQTTGSSNRQYIFGQEFNPGMYVVQVIQGKQIQTLKLVKGN